jgi:multiple sugar transport system permease protein
MVLPFALGLVLFTYLPLALVVGASFTSWSPLGTAEGIALGGYRETFQDPRFLNSLGVTAIVVIVTVPLQTALALGVAHALRRSRFASLIRPILLLPWMLAPIVIGLAWRWLTSPLDGVLAALAGREVDLATSQFGALMIVIGVLVWGAVGYLSLFFTAALAQIPDEFREQARIDGAGRWASLRYVTLPLLFPTTAFVVATSIATTAAVFDLVYTLTGGGPGISTEVLGMRLFTDGFVLFDLQRAAIEAIVIFAIAVPAIALTRRRIAAVR